MERYGQIQLPDITVIDTKALRFVKKTAQDGAPAEESSGTGSRDNGKPILSPALHTAIEQSLASGKQVILFQHRRG